MDELINQVVQKTGLPREAAATAVSTVMTYLKEKLPEPFGSQIEGLLSQGGGQDANNLLGGLGGLFKR